MNAVMKTDCPDLGEPHRGKVGDTYDLGDGTMLAVRTDRVSAFDKNAKTPIPGRGKVLNQLSAFWLRHLAALGDNHMITDDISQMPEAVQGYADQLEGRSMQVRKLDILPVEAIVRGYITGSGWKEYQKSGTVCDIPLPEGLVESQKLDQPLYTPSTKAEAGAHDENISPEAAAGILGEYADEVAQRAFQLYSASALHALERGIIIADTKFEFAQDQDGKVVLADEVLTPDSSRFWPADEYEPGRGQNSYDKQIVRTWIEGSGLKGMDGIELPDEIIERTMERYIEVFKLLTGAEPQL